MAELTKLERSILQWMHQRYDDSSFRAQIASAVVESRELTGVGSYTKLRSMPGTTVIDVSQYGGWPLRGPEIRAAQVEHGGGSLIWGQDGRISCIEVFAYGNKFNEQVTEFELLPFEEAQ